MLFNERHNECLPYGDERGPIRKTQKTWGFMVVLCFEVLQGNSIVCPGSVCRMPYGMVAEGGEGEKVVGDQSKHPWVARRELPVSVKYSAAAIHGTQPAHSEHCSNWLGRQHSFPDDSRGGQLENSRAWLCRQDRCCRNRMVSNSLSKSRQRLALMFMFEQVSRQTAVQMRYYPSCPRSSPWLLKRVLHMRNDQRYENKKPFHIFIKPPVRFQALLLIVLSFGVGFWDNLMQPKLASSFAT